MKHRAHAAAVIICAAAALCPAQRSEFQTLQASDGQPDDRYGEAVAVEGTIAVIGQPRDDDNGQNAGAAYLLDLSSGTEIAKLLAPDGAADDLFGASVAVSGPLAAVGAYLDDHSGFNSAGSVYLFDSSDGTQLGIVRKASPAFADQFGERVALDGDTLVVGATGDGNDIFAPGAAYVFDVSDPAHPVQLARLALTVQGDFDFFGRAVGVSGRLVVAGAPNRDNDRGHASVWDAATGAMLSELIPPDGFEGQLFGCSAAIEGSVAIVGARHDDEASRGAGAVYVFDLTDPQNPVLTHKLIARDAAYADNLGQSVGLNAGVAVVGADQGTGGEEGSGCAYLFDAASGAQFAKLYGTGTNDDDHFGSAVAISGSLALVGSPWYSGSNGSRSGGAFLFDTGPCEADFTGDGITNSRDVLVFLNLWNSGDPIADWNGDGTINSNDVLAYLNQWASGC